MNGQELTFVYGSWWWVLPAGIALMVLTFVVASFLRQRAKARAGNPTLMDRLTPSTSTAARTVRHVLFALAVLLVGLAALRPQFGTEELSAKGSGIDLVIALDISNSMLVADVPPTDRLTGSVLELSALLGKLDGGRVALVPFSGIAFQQTPLTSDFDAVRMMLSNLRPQDVPVPGTALGRALDVSLSTLIADRKSDKSDADSPGEAQVTEFKPFDGAKYKAILLVTDGEDHTKGAMELATEAASRGIKIYTVGVGSPMGSVVPKIDDDGRETGGNLIDPASGNVVISQLNEKLLQDIATLTGGRYFKYEGQPLASDIYKELSGLEKKEYEAVRRELQVDRYAFVLLPAILLLALEWTLSERRRRR